MENVRDPVKKTYFEQVANLSETKFLREKKTTFPTERQLVCLIYVQNSS